MWRRSALKRRVEALEATVAKLPTTPHLVMNLTVTGESEDLSAVVQERLTRLRENQRDGR